MTSVPSTDPRGAERAPASRRRRGSIMSYGEGRTCMAADCSTMLSRYNNSDLCWQHADELEQRKHRGRT